MLRRLGWAWEEEHKPTRKALAVRGKPLTDVVPHWSDEVRDEAGVKLDAFLAISFVHAWSRRRCRPPSPRRLNDESFAIALDRGFT